jgi:hypothetical protein
MTKDANAYTSVRVLKIDRDELNRLRDDLVNVSLEQLTSPLDKEVIKKLMTQPLLIDDQVEALRGLEGQAYTKGAVLGLAIAITRRVVTAMTEEE